MIETICICLGTYWGLGLIGLGFMLGFARMAGLTVIKARLFSGPAFASLGFLGTRFEIGCFPFGSSIELWPASDHENHALNTTPISRVLIVSAAVPLTLALGGLLCLGGQEFVQSGLRGLWQFWLGGFLFWSHGVEMLREGRALLQDRGPMALVGNIAAKWFFLQLLPLPMTSIGLILTRLWRTPMQWWHLFGAISFVLTLLAHVGWAIAHVLVVVVD